VDHFTWGSLLVGHEYDHTFTATLVIAGLLAWALVGLRQLRTAADPIVPDATLTARNSLEIFVEWFVGFSEGVLGSKAKKYLPPYATFFLFIVAANLIGLIPGFSPPTSNFNVTFALGVTSFVLYNYFAIREKGGAYFKHFLGPIWWLIILMLPLELIDNFVRPFSLAFRLFGNMTGDHLVIGIFTDLTKLGIPVLFLMLGTLVCVIQAFVFTILSMVYLALAVEDHGEHHEHH
jgi:F-type H+-transporting ATPase subunit a